MIGKIEIEYHVVERGMTLDCGKFTTFESLGLLEAAKASVAQDWLDKDPEHHSLTGVDLDLKLNNKIVIEYHLIKGTIVVDCGDFTTFESLGLLEAAKALVAGGWLRQDSK